MNPTPGPVAVCGGINMDIHVRAVDRFVRGTSNPASIHHQPGGVGRNIAANLAALGIPVRLFGCVGGDELSARLLSATEAEGVDISGVRRVEGASAGVYVAFVDRGGELEIAASDMEVTDAFDTGYAEEVRADLEGAALVVADANLAQGTLQRILDIATAAGRPVVIEPVSVPKAERLRGLTGDILALTPNADEAAVLRDLPAELRVAHWFVTQGARGVLWRDAADGREEEVSARPVTVRNVTGAGDAFVAGLVAGLWRRAQDRGTAQSSKAAPSEGDLRAAIALALEVAAEVVGSERSTIERRDR
jgi:pseudouridine kinase